MNSRLTMSMLAVVVIAGGLGWPLVAGGDNRDDIERLIAQIPKLPTKDVGRRKTDERPFEREGAKCAAVNYSETRAWEELVAIDPGAGIVWPGAIVRGQSVLSTRLAPVPLERAAGTLTLTNLHFEGESSAYSKSIASPSSATVQEAIQELLRQPVASTAAGISAKKDEFSSLEHALVQVGIEAKWLTGRIKTELSSENYSQQNNYFLELTQRYYTVAFEPNGPRPRDFFGLGATAEDARLYMGGGSGSAAGAGGGEYFIRSVSSNKVIDVAGGAPGAGAVIQQYQWHGGANQRWRIETVEDSYVRIVSSGTGGCLEAGLASTADDAAVRQGDYDGRDNQKWRMEPTPDGSIVITSKPTQSQKALDVPGAVQDDIALQLYQRHGGPNQLWRLEPVDGSSTGSMADPPIYISSVTYGRKLLFLFSSREDKEDLKAAVEASYNFGIKKGSATISSQEEQTLNNSEIRILVLGGPSASVAGFLAGDGAEGVKEYLTAGANFGADSPGVPIGYELRYLSDRTTATVYLTTDYVAERCEPVKFDKIWLDVFTLDDDKDREEQVDFVLMDDTNRRLASVSAGQNEVWHDHTDRSFEFELSGPVELRKCKQLRVEVYKHPDSSAEGHGWNMALEVHGLTSAGVTLRLLKRESRQIGEGENPRQRFVFNCE